MTDNPYLKREEREKLRERIYGDNQVWKTNGGLVSGDTASIIAVLLDALDTLDARLHEAAAREAALAQRLADAGILWPRDGISDAARNLLARAADGAREALDEKDVYIRHQCPEETT